MKSIILKIGGSVATYKNREDAEVRKDVLVQIAKEIHQFLEKQPDTRLVLVHGAGSHGHQLAKQYDLKSGVFDDERKLRGAVLCRQAVLELHTEICRIFVDQGLPMYSVLSGATIIQNNGKIVSLQRDILDYTMHYNMIPVFHGDMVFDQSQTMSVCSGDDIAVYIANLIKAEKIIFASDIDGIYTNDPYEDDTAELISHIHLDDLFAEHHINIAESHNTDVTGGLHGKVKTFQQAFEYNNHLREIVICNGLKTDVLKHVLDGKSVRATKIIKGTTV